MPAPKRTNKTGTLIPRRFTRGTKLKAPTKGLKKTELDARTSATDRKPNDAAKRHKKPVKRKEVPQPRGVKRGILPDQPCASIYCGLSKSGKSTLLKETLTDPELLGGYFHTIIMFSPTANADSTITEALKLPPENIITNFEEEDLIKIIDAQRELIADKGYNWVARHARMAFIFDDCISHQKFLKSRTMIDLTATVRHNLISVFFLIQSYRMVARSCRINMRGIAFFQSNRNETDILVDEECPPTHTKLEFRNVIHHATNEKYSFLFVNKDQPFNRRYMVRYDERFVF